MPPWECDNCHEEAKPVVLLRCPKCLWETEADEQEPPEQECSPCPLEGRVVALEARLQALELAIIADVAEIEKLKTLAEQGTDLFEEHDERLQALERPAAPAQRQPLTTCCSACERFPDCLSMYEPNQGQPRQGAGL